MSAETVEILDDFTAIAFLANGSGVYHKPILLGNVTWDEYLRYLKKFKEKSGWRLAYDEGNLEFMPPLREHEEPSRTLDMMVYDFCVRFDLVYENSGATTFRCKAKTKGVEPDSCYYVQNEPKIIGQRNLKPETYPVPDIAMEIDVTHGSLDKFKIYADLGVADYGFMTEKTFASSNSTAQNTIKSKQARICPV